jgi:spore germination protein YaaH
VKSSKTFTLILFSLMLSLLPSARAQESVTTTTQTNTQTMTDPNKPPRRIWSGWIPYYSMRTSLPAAVNNQDLIREVMLFWYTIKGPTRILDLYKDANPSVPIDTPLAQLRSAGYLLIPTLTDGTEKLELQKILAKPTERTQLVATIMELVRSKNFDGIDLDLEGFAFVDGTASWAKTAPLWVEFVRELSVALKAEGKILSVTTPVAFDPASGKRGYWVYDWAGIAPYIDRLRIMTYDYATSRPGPIGPLFWAEDALKYAVKVIPSSQVFLGVAGYGRDWVTKVEGTCPKDVAGIVKVGAKASTFVMRDAANLIAKNGASAEYRVREGEVNFTYQRTYTGVTAKGTPTTCTASRTAWYQDARGYTARANLVSKYRLGGLVAWTIGMEEVNAISAVRSVARDIAPDVVRADLRSDLNQVRYGDVVTLNAAFTLADKAPVANLPMTIEMKREGGAWRKIHSAISDASGVVEVRTVIGRGVTFRALSEGSWERLASSSSEVKVASRPLLTLNAPTLMRVGKSETLTATLTPTIEGATIALERFDRGKSAFALISKAKVDSDGQARFTHIEKSAGFASLRLRLISNQLTASELGGEDLVSSSLWVTLLQR